MYLEKIKVMNMISKRKDNEGQIIELIENPDELLEDLKYYFPNFLFFLWDKPNLMAQILQKAELDDVQNYLAPFIANNFYENVLSSSYIEENLMFVLTILLRDEINSLLYIDQNVSFLDNTCCGYMLEELRKKKDIQTYFKSIISDSVENLEANYSSLKLKFNVEEMHSSYIQLLRTKNAKGRIKNEDIYLNPAEDQNIEGINYRDRKKILLEQVNFNKKYIPNMDCESLQKFVEENNININKDIYEYYYSQINTFSGDKSIFTNQKLLLNLNAHKNSDKLLYIYQNNFVRVIDFIDKILENISNNFHLLPYSLRVFCKIISNLVEQKFPSITEPEKMIFVSKFLFKVILIPILKNPAVEALINNFIITENTLNNLQIISQILDKLVSGVFYSSDKEDESGYTPFNWYFIEKSGQLYDIYKHVTRVRLPPFIEDFINNKLPENFEYDYFKENQDEAINFRSICFNMHEALVLINTLERCINNINYPSDITTLKKTLNKLVAKTSRKIIGNIILKEKLSSKKEEKHSIFSFSSTEKDSSKDTKPKKYYFLLTSMLTNNDFKKLFEIEQPSPDFKLKEIKKPTDEESINKNNIIKVKNFICSLLYNFDKLVKTNFEPSTIETTEKILEELNILMKSSYFVMDGSIPFDWYVKSIFEYLKKIPSYYTNNDCEELYKEIEEDINKSIAQLDFVKLSSIMEKIKYAKRGKIFYQDTQKNLTDIKLNEEVKRIINEEFIPVKIKFEMHSEEDKKATFFIESCGFKEKDKDNLEKIQAYEKSKQVSLALTIVDFTKKFPNLLNFQKFLDFDVFELQENLHFPDFLSKYFEIVFEHLEEKKELKTKFGTLNKFKENIIDFVMGKLYDKIFPLKPNISDNKIFTQTVRLSWTQPDHYLGGNKKYVFGSFLSDIDKYYKQLNIEKSPRKKLLSIDGIEHTVSFFYLFNGKNEIGLDDQISILSYAMVKVQPIIYDSNIQFMRLYGKMGGLDVEGNKLDQLTAVGDFIKDVKYDNLNGVTLEEFNKECNKTNNIK